MRPARGFSLVEVLVTLLVLGIAAGAMSLAVTADRERDPAVAVEQLRKALETAAYRASIRGQRLAIEFQADGYRFTSLDRHGQWQRIDADPALQPRRLPAGLAWHSLATSSRQAGTTASPAHRRIEFGTRPPQYRLALAHEGVLHVLDGSRAGSVVHRLEHPGAGR